MDLSTVKYSKVHALNRGSLTTIRILAVDFRNFQIFVYFVESFKRSNETGCGPCDNSIWALRGLDHDAETQHTRSSSCAVVAVQVIGNFHNSGLRRSEAICSEQQTTSVWRRTPYPCISFDGPLEGQLAGTKKTTFQRSPRRAVQREGRDEERISTNEHQRPC